MHPFAGIGVPVTMGSGARSRELSQALVDAEVPVEVASLVGAAFGSRKEAAPTSGALIRLVRVQCAKQLRAEGLESGIGRGDIRLARCHQRHLRENTTGVLGGIAFVEGRKHSH